MLILLIVLLMTLGGPMNAKNANDPEKRLFPVPEEPDYSITVTGTGKFFIEIPSNPSTGYSWAVEKVADETVIAFVSAVEPDERGKETGAPQLLGAPSSDVFAFNALKIGTTKVILNYKRPWEKNIAPIKTCTLHVTVQ